MYLIYEKLQNGELDVIGCDDIVSMTGLEEKQAVGILGRMVRNKLLIPTGNPQKGKKTYMLAQKYDDEQLSYSKEAREQRYNEAVSMIKKAGLRDEAKKLLLNKLMENSINSLRIIPYLVNQVQDGVHIYSVSNDVPDRYDWPRDIVTARLCKECFDIILNEKCGDSNAGQRERAYIEENEDEEDYTSTGEYENHNIGFRWRR